MNRFAFVSGAFILAALLSLTVLAATPTTAPVRSTVQARSTYDPFVMARAAAAQPGTAAYDAYQRRAEIVKWLKDKDKVKTPRPQPHRSPVKPPDEGDGNNGHGNNDGNDDPSNPGQGNGNHGTGNNGNDDDHRNDKGSGR